MKLPQSDIEFIQSSYRDAKSKASQRNKLRELYPYILNEEFAEITGTNPEEWESPSKPSKSSKKSVKQDHALLLDRMIFQAFNLLVELSRERDLPIDTHWREALNKLESLLSGKVNQVSVHPATLEYEVTIAAILTADDMAKKKCSAGPQSEQSTKQTNTPV